MFIMNQKRNELVNLDNVVLLAKYNENEYGETEYYAYANNHSVSLGTYEKTSGHGNLLEKIAKSIGATEVFYMPEE